MDEQFVVGKIIKVAGEGWGFISSREIEFTRIFFHWTALVQDTLPFKELKPGMKVEFKPVQVPERGWRAHKVRVIQEEKKNNENTGDLPALPE